jgi:hypothetical protein
MQITCSNIDITRISRFLNFFVYSSENSFVNFSYFNLLPSLAPFGQAVSEENFVLTLANQKQELPLVAIFVGGMGRNEETL